MQSRPAHSWRWLLANFLHREITGRYAGAAGGMAWALAHPLAQLAIFAAVFGFILRVPEGTLGGLRFAGFLAIALWPWFMFAEGLQRAVANFSSIKEDQEIIRRIRLDVTPHMVMEPRFHSRPGDLKKLGEITGYMFYVEGECEPPALMLMKTGKTDITSTISRVEDIPQEIVSRAVESPVQTPIHGMYAITDEIRDWLKKELGL